VIQVDKCNEKSVATQDKDLGVMMDNSMKVSLFRSSQTSNQHWELPGKDKELAENIQPV